MLSVQGEKSKAMTKGIETEFVIYKIVQAKNFLS